eukprot:6345197-Amphidinium_carterae.1
MAASCGAVLTGLACQSLLHGCWGSDRSWCLLRQTGGKEGLRARMRCHNTTILSIPQVALAALEDVTTRPHTKKVGKF